MSDPSREIDLLAGFPAEGGPGGAGAPPSPLASVRRVLRGRVWLAALLGGVLAAAGATAGWSSQTLQYKAVGLIQIVPKTDVIVGSTPENSLMPMFDSFVAGQVALMKSGRVVAAAMDSEEWRGHGFGTGDEERSEFQKRLVVTPSGRSQMIPVVFQHSDARATQAAVNSVIDAYMKVVEESATARAAGTIQELTGMRDTALRTLQDLRSRESRTTDGAGDGPLNARYAELGLAIPRKQQEVKDLDVAIDELEKALAEVGNAQSAATEEKLATTDTTLRQLLDDRERARKVVEGMLGEYGERAPQMKAARAAAALAAEQVENRVAFLRDQAALSGGAAGSLDDQLRAKQTERLRAQAELAALKQESTEVFGKLQQVNTIRTEIAKAQQDIDVADRRIRELEREDAGRVSVAARAQRPTSPEGDRRLPLAAMGAMSGACLGVLLVIVFGLVSSRMRHLEDISARVQGERFVAMLPDVDADAALRADTVDMGEFCVHHIRTLLQIRGAAKHHVLALTSPSPAAGKTTLALSVGASFGATGARVLLIDGDFVGHGLTSAVRALVAAAVERQLEAVARGEEAADPRASSRIANLLAARARSWNDSELDGLRRRAADEYRGGTDLERAVASLESFLRYRDARGSGGDGRRGVLDALNGRALEDCVLDTGVPRVAVLPVGEATGREASQLSPELLRGLVTRCRERYDVIIIDTGPILGSLEASFVAALADEVLFVVQRGEKRSLVDEAMTRLERVGANVAGVVFNRASVEDVVRSSYASRSPSVAVGAA